MNPYLVVTGAGGSLEDILILAVAGVVVVVLALTILSIVVSLFRHLVPKDQSAVVEEMQKAPSQPAVEEINKSLFFDISKLDENQITAIFTAVSIELKLYHEIEPAALTFDYRPRSISPWSMAN